MFNMRFKMQRKRKRRGALLFGISLCFFVLVSFSQTASADKAANKSYVGGDPFVLNEYSREGSTVSLAKSISVADIDVCNHPDVTCQNLVSGNPQIEFTCHGAGGSSANGYWGDPSYSGVCWTSLDVCYFAGTINEYCEDYTASNRNIISEPLNRPTITSSSLCSSPQKGVCNIESSGGFYYNQSAVIDTYVDDMFSIDPNTSLFVEYPALSGANATSYIARNSVGTNNRMMIPSSTADFTRFLSNPPPSVTREKACQTLSVVDFCTAKVSPTPTTIDGVCKAIPGSHVSQPATDTASGCDAGSYIDLSDTSTEWQWRCDGIGTPVGTNSPTCTASKPSGGTFVHVFTNAENTSWDCDTVSGNMPKCLSWNPGDACSPVGHYCVYEINCSVNNTHKEGQCQ